MTSILILPAEVLLQILAHLSYTSLTRFSQTCREAHSFTSPQNQSLWKAVFCLKFDDPQDRRDSLTPTAREQSQQRETEWDWLVELRRRVLALKWVGGDGNEAAMYWDETEIDNLVGTFLDILDTAKTCPTPAEIQAGRKPTLDDRTLSLNLDLLPSNYEFTGEFDGLVRGLPVSASRGLYDFDEAHVMGMPGAWNDTPGKPTTRSQTTRQMEKMVRSEAGSRLHVLCGLTVREVHDVKAVGRARRVTYDWSLTGEKNEYGPFKDDGSGLVDWKRLESICTVVARQFSSALRGRMILPQGFCFSIPHRTLSDPTVPEDWARATGTWCGTYVFLHWEDLVHFNAHQGHTNRPTLENGPEACGGLMKLELKLNMDLKDDPKLKTNLPVCHDLPTLYFSGLSKSYDFQMATNIRGMACLVPGGREVRWRYIVSYNGSDQWQLEGVQAGGIRSGSVIGTWTSCAHEEGGPVGPFFYAPEELCKPTSIVLHTT